MRHLITVAFLVAAGAAYWFSASPELAGVGWLAGFLFLGGMVCEGIFYWRTVRGENASRRR